MKKVIRNVEIGVAVLIAIMVLMPISFVKTGDRRVRHIFFLEEPLVRYCLNAMIAYSFDASTRHARVSIYHCKYHEIVENVLLFRCFPTKRH
jgi:hypothetical protein